MEEGSCVSPSRAEAEERKRGMSVKNGNRNGRPNRDMSPFCHVRVYVSFANVAKKQGHITEQEDEDCTRGDTCICMCLCVYVCLTVTCLCSCLLSFGAYVSSRMFDGSIR